MKFYEIRNYVKSNQYIISIMLIILTALSCIFLVNIIGYRAVALILLMVVSINAILFDIYPVMFSAVLSALIWNFFFIPPTLTFHIGTPEDGLMFLMYFVIASINAVLTYKIREHEKKDRDAEEKAKTIKLYNTLLSSLSHELRTPISTIIGAIDTIKDNQTRLSDIHKIELFTEIENASLRLNRQVENLLSMSKLESGFIQPRYEWCDMNELIFSAIKENYDSSTKHNIEFIPNENLPLLKLDRVMIQQIIQNIIHNAFQHTPENSTIKIDVHYYESDCIINIKDNGAGFPVDEIDFVFNKFYRLKNSNPGGTGLGLSIVKGFTEAMNGTVLLENLTTGGAKFSIKIPCEFTQNIIIENE